MTEDKENYYSVHDILTNIKEFLLILRSKWWMLLLACIVGVAFGLIYYSSQSPKYEAVSSFILDDKSSGSGSGLASLASQIGISVGSGGGGNIFGGDNILNILKSKRIVQQVLVTKLDSGYNNRTLADLYLDFTGLRKSWSHNPTIANISFNDTSKRTIAKDSVLDILYEQIVKNNLAVERASKQGSIIKVQVTASNPVFARMMTERLVSEASKLYMTIRTGAAEANIKELQSRSDSLLSLLNRKSFVAAASQPLDINPAVRTASVPLEIANRDKTVLATLYGEVTKNLEASKMILSQERPVIQILDEPGLALQNKKKGKLMVITVGAFIGVSFVVTILLLTYVLKTPPSKGSISSVV